LSIPANQTNGNQPQGFPIGLLSSLMESLAFWISLITGILALIALVLTKPRSEPELIEHYVDNETDRYIQVIEVHLKFARNPLFRRIKIFEYSGNARYEIIGLEFGTYDTILPKGSYEDKQVDDHREIWMREKSLLKERRISVLRINMETEAGDYQKNMKAEINSERIEITNDNSEAVRKYAIRVHTIKDVEKLRKDPKVDDVYQEGAQWVIIVKEIPPKRLQHSGKETVWF